MAVTIGATSGDGGWVLTGDLAHVVDGAAEVLVVVARAEEGVLLFVVAAGADGLVVEPHSTMDLTRRQARIRFEGTPAREVAGAAETPRICAETVDIAAILHAAGQVGAARRLLELSVEYGRTRLQFGRPIGSFQAVKHKCADMLVEVEQAASTAYHAAWVVDEGGDDVRIAASLAQAICSDAFYRVAAATIQVHGGIGFTWEHPAHLYYKRAVTDAALLGGAADHRERLAELVLD